eukprot:g6363.t1
MLDDLTEDLHFDKNRGGALASSIFYLGCAIGGVIANHLERYLHRFSQTGVALVYFLGSILSGFSSSSSFCWGGPLNGCVPYMLFFGRLLTGVGGGLGSVISPRYLAEVAPPKIRGLLGVITEVALVCGVLVGFLIGLPYEFDEFDIGYSWWRVMFLIGAIPAILQALSNWVSLTEIDDSKDGVELTSVRTVTQKELAREDSKPIEDDLEKTKPPSSSKSIPIAEPAVRDWKILFHKKYRIAVALGLGMPISAQLSGINVIGTYSTTIFEEAGFSKAIVGSILMGVTNLICTLISAMVYEKFNRRTIAFVSYSGMGLSMAAVAFADLGAEHIRGPLSVVFVLLYMASFSAGAGTLSLHYAPEMVPPEIEHLVLGIGQSLSYFVTLILVLIFPTILDEIGALPSFLALAVFSLGTVAFLKIYMVETRGRRLEDVHKDVLKE